MRMPDGNRAAEIAQDRRESEVDEEEAAEFWERQDEWMRGYYEARKEERTK